MSAVAKAVPKPEPFAVKPGLTVNDAYKTDQETWEYVTIPAENALGNAHDNIGLNKETFVAGQTYKVPAPIAAYLKERLREYAKSCVRVLQPKRDYKAEQAVSIGTSSGGAFTPVDASQISTQ